VIERFDRQRTRDGRLLRSPQEDLCQALSVPPELKYQAHGGPGIRDISALLQGSDQPEHDRRAFFKAQVIFWLMAATDAHAKNFSVRLAPGGRFRLTPLYDVLSTQPAHDAGQIRNNAFKMAMFVGDNRHYLVDRILPRHFIQTAARCALPIDVMPALFEEVAAAIPPALDAARNAMPPDFPGRIADRISDAMLRRTEELLRFFRG
jgi:serine/threonine-protein kinase HipA